MHDGFTIFGTDHILAVLVTCIFSAAVLSYLHSRPDRGSSLNLLRVLGIFVILNAIFWRILPIFQGDFDLKTDLPCHLCGVIPFLLGIYLISPAQKIFDIIYYWIMTGSSLALLIPEIQNGFPSRQFLAHFITHAVPLLMMVHLLINCKKRPSPESYNYAFFALALFALFFALPVDLLTGGNYLYLFSPPTADFKPIGLLPSWPWYLIPIGIFFYLMFRLVNYPVKTTAAVEVQEHSNSTTL